MRLPRRHAGRDEYERLRAAGTARRFAALQAGVIERTAKDWDWGDLLLDSDTITAVGPTSARGDAVVVDAAATVLSPGFVDTHRRTREAQLRRIMPDVDDLGGYVMSTLAGHHGPPARGLVHRHARAPWRSWVIT